MTANAPATPVPPYDAMLDIASSGRVFLAKAMTHYCLLHWGLDAADVSAALGPESRSIGLADEQVKAAASLLGRAFADGLVRTHARPFRGGVPVALPREVWELDRHEIRFRDSALNLADPYDPSAAPTHWLFVDAEDWDALVEASCGSRPGTRPSRRPAAAMRADERGADWPDASEAGALLTLPEVKARTKLGKSTIYAKMAAGDFPAQVDPGARIATWRETEVDGWVGSRPRRARA